MTACEEIVERMPDAALGRASWSVADRRHLAECADCRAAWAAIEATTRLARRAPVVDPALIAAGVRGRMTAHRRDLRLVRRWVGLTGLAAAAALAVVVWPHRAVPPAVATQIEAGSVFLPELDSLSTTELRSVLESVDRPLGSLRTLDSQGLGDLSDQELAGVLQAMEG